MRIDSSHPNLDGPDAAERASAKRTDTASKSGRDVQSGTDRVQVSPDAALLNEALKVASEEPGIRGDVVEKMRQKLLEGEIGQDTHRLADRMIDHLLDS